MVERVKETSESVVAGQPGTGWGQIYGIMEQAVAQGLERRKAEAVSQTGADAEVRLGNIITHLEHRTPNAARRSINAKMRWLKNTARALLNWRNFVYATFSSATALTWPPRPPNSRQRHSFMRNCTATVAGLLVLVGFCGSGATKSAASATDLPCKACDRTVRIGVYGLFGFLVSYEMPGHFVFSGRKLPNTPLEFDLRVDASGVPCSVTDLTRDHPEITSPLRSAIQRWRFRAPVIVGAPTGTPVCLHAKVFVYLRREASHVTFIVPGLTDRKKP